MRLVLLAAAALAASTGVALAGQPAPADAQRAASQLYVCEGAHEATSGWIRACAERSQAAGVAARAEPARRVFVCDRSSETRQNWVRAYGSITFVTAEDLARAETANEQWSSPRCMTSSEARRFTKGRPEEAMVARAINAAPGI